MVFLIIPPTTTYMLLIGVNAPVLEELPIINLLQFPKKLSHKGTLITIFKTSLTLRTVHCTGPRLWNNIPKDLGNNHSQSFAQSTKLPAETNDTN